MTDLPETLDLGRQIDVANTLATELRARVQRPLDRVQIAMVVSAVMSIEHAQHDFVAAKHIVDHFNARIMELFQDGTISIPHEVHG